jgi:hypothetical protein
VWEVSHLVFYWLSVLRKPASSVKVSKCCHASLRYERINRLLGCRELADNE